VRYLRHHSTTGPTCTKLHSLHKYRPSSRVFCTNTYAPATTHDDNSETEPIRYTGYVHSINVYALLLIWFSLFLEFICRFRVMVNINVYLPHGFFF
jgi:hypothetical protein